MKRMLVVGGSIGVVVLLMLAMFTMVVSAQTLKMINNDTYKIIKNKSTINNNLVEFLLALLSSILLPIIYGIFFIIAQFFP